jgi:pimeloyl-ACP methyl ester carboxylesterase
MTSTEIRHRQVATNGIELHVAEAGEGPLVVLCHGFPESWYSWRHQIEPLAAAGYHVLAPDLRGYGDSTKLPNVDDYGIEKLNHDLLGLLDDAGEEQGVFVGHDWGALIVWDLARLHPERVRGVVGVSVPLMNWGFAPVPAMRAALGERFYIVYFQEVGPAETEMERDVRDTMTRTLWGASGDFARLVAEGKATPGSGGFLDAMPMPPEQLPAWLTEEDIDVYTAQFEKSGFFGPVSFYRNLDANWELTNVLPIERISMPSAFIGGDRDGVVTMSQGRIDAMPSELPDYRGSTILEGPGHWTQQEDPDGFNAALLKFLGGL